MSSVELLKPMNDGRLFIKFVADTFLLIGVPVGSSTTVSYTHLTLPTTD